MSPEEILDRVNPVRQSLLSTPCSGGDEGTRTPGIRLAKAALSQLSYIPNGPLLRGSGGPFRART
jgi:hypothetical protein